MARHPSDRGIATLSRAARTARGSLGALASTLLAAAAHALAGGEVTALGLVATSVLALPVCVALAGRVGSLWRLALAVGVSQFIYHWSFAGLGLAQSGAGDVLAAPVSPHAHHLHAVTLLPPALASAGTADALMWAAHAAGAVATVALLWRGERAALGLRTLLRRLLPAVLPARPLPHVPTRLLTRFERRDEHRERLVFLTAISHRGPPRLLAPAS